MTTYFKYRVIIHCALALSIVLLFVVIINSNYKVFFWLTVADRTAFLVGLMGASISLLGFVVAASAFLVSHLQHERFVLIRQSRSWSQLVGTIKSSLWRLLALATYAALCVFAEPQNFRLWATGLVLLSTLTVTTLSTLIWTMTAIYALPTSGDR